MRFLATAGTEILTGMKTAIRTNYMIMTMGHNTIIARKIINQVK